MPATVSLINFVDLASTKERLALYRPSRCVTRACDNSDIPDPRLQILQNEQQTWSDLVQYVRENNVNCDLWVGDTLDVPITPEVAAVIKDSFDRFKAAGGEVSHIKVTYDPVEAEKVLK